MNPRRDDHYGRTILIPWTDQLADVAGTQVYVEREAELVELEAMPVHVHLLVGIDPQYGIHRLVNQIKGRSSRLLCDEFWRLRRRLPTRWTNAYFVPTVGSDTLEIIKQYVANQRNV